jgi:hypothetical protein
MVSTIARRIKRLEDLKFKQRAETGPDLVATLLARRRKHAIAESQEPEPDRPPGPVDSGGYPFSLADVLPQRRKKPDAS